MENIIKREIVLKSNCKYIKGRVNTVYKLKDYTLGRKVIKIRL